MIYNSIVNPKRHIYIYFYITIYTFVIASRYRCMWPLSWCPCEKTRSSLLNRVSQFGTVAKVSSMPGQTKQAAWYHGHKKLEEKEWENTLPGTNISYLGKRKIIFKSALVGDMLVPRRGGTDFCLICFFLVVSVLSSKYTHGLGIEWFSFQTF